MCKIQIKVKSTCLEGKKLVKTKVEIKYMRNILNEEFDPGSG